MTNTMTVPLDKLDADPMNVRKTYRVEGVEELAASLLAKGQLQNLVVRKGKKGRYFVTAGGRRLAAFNRLAEQGKIEKNHMIECKERDAAEATEISLAENVMRETMHRADEFEAYLAMAEAGKTPAQIAERFGTSELIVNRRLALSKVSPVIFEMYRNDEVDFEQLQAFTITDDHARQVEIWNSLPSYNRHPHTIKRMLAGDEIHAQDKRVKFIGGLDAYEAAGGTVRRDLFDEKKGGYATDSGLVEQLVFAKLDQAAEPVRAEGWKWVEVYSARPDDIFNFGRVYPERQELPEADQKRMDELTAAFDDLADQIEADEDAKDARARLEQIEAEMETLTAAMDVYKPADKAKAGAMVFMDFYGNTEIARGLVRAEDKNDEGSTEEGPEAGNSEGEAEAEAPVMKHSAALIEDLTAQKTAALRVEFANNPDIALVAVVHALLLGSVYRTGSAYNSASGHSALQISLTHEAHEVAMKNPESCKGAKAFADMQERWGDKLPGNPADLWEWCYDQSRDELLSLMAFAAAHSLNAMEPKFHCRSTGIAHANQIGKALNVDMRDWFTTTGDSYFRHLNRQSIELAVAEARGADFAQGIAGMKKAEAATYADRQVEGTGWLPSPIRINTPADEGDELPEAAE